MLTKGEIVINTNNGRRAKVVALRKAGYFDIEYIDQITEQYNDLVHESYLKRISDIQSKSIELNLGSGDVLSNKLYMMDIYLLITLQLGYPFYGIKYIDENKFITQIDNEHKEFIVERIDYDSKFFIWKNTTFKNNSDFTMQVGLNFIRVFHNKTLRSRLAQNVEVVDGKMHFTFVKKGLSQSGVIGINNDKTEFVCQYRLIEDLVYHSDLIKNK